MDTNVAYNNDNFALCTIPEAEPLKQCSTIGRLLNELEMTLSHELEINPASEATKDLKDNLEILNKQYQEEIPKIVDNYQQEYPSWIREKLPKAEEQYKKLVNWSDDIDNPGKEFRQAIDELREKYYDNTENCLKVEWERTQQQLKNGKCCRDRALKRQEIIEQEFANSKRFKETINNWFKELDKIYKQAEELLDQENYKALYAYRLEFHSILQELRQLKPDETKRRTPNSTIVKDWEWLKSLLTKHLRNYCLITYEYFYWQKNWLELIEQEEKAASNYRDFKKSRGEDFVREAQDVELPPEDDGCNDRPPTRYQDTVAM